MMKTAADWEMGELVDVSLSGALLQPAELPAIGETIHVKVPSVGEICAEVIRHDGNRVGVRFGEIPGDQLDRLICWIYTEQHDNAIRVGKFWTVSARLARGVVFGF